jgi:hypothetical protein
LQDKLAASEAQSVADKQVIAEETAKLGREQKARAN